MARRACSSSILLVLLCCVACPALAGVRYDQTQTGDYNVHLDLKNIEIIAYVDSGALGINDYEYDYNDYTLKPPSNGSVVPSGSFGGSSSSSSNTSSNSSAVTVPTNGTAAGSPDRPLNGTEVQPVPVISGTGSEQNDTTAAKPTRRCGAGFYRDSAGRCRRLRRPIKLTGLLQKATNRISGK